MNTRRLFLFLTIALAAGCSKSADTPTSPPGGGGGGNPTLNASADSIRMATNSSCAVHVIASDPNNYQLTFAYSAKGGSVAAGSPTSTSAIFTPTRVGNDSVIVSADNGHGGQSTATVLVYAVAAGMPGFAKSLDCAFRFTPAESLIVLSCTLCVSNGPGQGCTPGGVGNLPAGVLPPAVQYIFWPADDPGHTCNDYLTTWDIIVQRPMPDGRGYHFGGLR